MVQPPRIERRRTGCPLCAGAIVGGLRVEADRLNLD
jgi:hypothetical protein